MSCHASTAHACSAMPATPAGSPAPLLRPVLAPGTSLQTSLQRPTGSNPILSHVCLSVLLNWNHRYPLNGARACPGHTLPGTGCGLMGLLVSLTRWFPPSPCNEHDRTTGLQVSVRYGGQDCTNQHPPRGEAAQGTCWQQSFKLSSLHSIGVLLKCVRS